MYLNDPANSRDAAFSAYRNYGRFGAWFKGTIPAGGTQTLRVRFLVCKGELPAADVIQAAYNEFAGVRDPVPPTTRKQADQPAPPKAKAPAK